MNAFTAINLLRLNAHLIAPFQVDLCKANKYVTNTYIVNRPSNS